MACSPSKPLPCTPSLSHTHPALCRVRECDLVPIPEEGWTLMTASSDTLRCSEPPSPAGSLCSLGQDPLVHTGRGLQSGVDSVAKVHPVCPYLVWKPFCHALLVPGWLFTVDPNTLGLSTEDSATGGRPVVSVQCTMSAAPQLCVCVFIRGDSYAQWNKDTVNHNQMGVCTERVGVSEEVGGGVRVSWMFGGMPRSNVGRWRRRTGGGWQRVAFEKIRIGVPRTE